jgi:uncharacterized membrane protein
MNVSNIPAIVKRAAKVHTAEPMQLSRELRQGTGGFLPNRRRILTLSLAAAASMGMISLYQMGVIRHLPEPSLPYLNADKVDASEEAFSWLSTPDGVIGVASYGVTALLASVGGKDRVERRPWIPLALAAKALADAAQAARLTRDQWTKHRAFCSYCLFAAGATFAAVPFVIPEARAAIRRLFGKR